MEIKQLNMENDLMWDFTMFFSCQSVFVGCEFDTFLVLLIMDVMVVVWQNLDEHIVVFSRCWCLQLVFDCIFL